MPQLVEVRFKGNRKAYFEWGDSEPLREREAVIVESDRGADFGLVSATDALARRKCDRCRGCATGGDDGPPRREPEPTRRVLRRASDGDRQQHEDLRGQEDDVRRRVREKVRQHDLPMKVSDAEWQWDRNKLTVYFTAEKRVDFRQLVRELAGMFRTRIELRQIGVRDEAARLSGIGRCGREYCSASWLPELRPIGLHVAKDQRLSLNPTQISGPCGRLLCCLRYEHEFYVHSRKRFPKEGKVLQTAAGFAKVHSVDIFRDRVTLRAEDGAFRTVELADLKREVEQAASGVPPAPDAAPAPAPTPPRPDERNRRPRPPRGEKPRSDAPVATVPPAPTEPAGAGETEPTAPRRRRRRRRRGRSGPPGSPPPQEDPA